ncbi:MAG: hypothetical protein JWM62_1574, partial [Frankiales bacterium]|nr:hypothetical protein [Frankiales bacterium]
TATATASATAAGEELPAAAVGTALGALLLAGVGSAAGYRWA